MQKLTAEQVKMMRIMRSRGADIEDLAFVFNLSTSHTAKVCCGRERQDAPGPLTKEHRAHTSPTVTARKEAVLAFIVQFSTDHGFTPTIREIVDGTDITSTSIAGRYLAALEKDERISRVPHLARTIKVL